MTAVHEASPDTPQRTAAWWKQSPRSCSPIAIVNDAKEFVKDSPSLPPRLRPTLDPSKTPFGVHATGCNSDPLVRPPGVTAAAPPPGRLPSLSMEAFTAMKRREGLESRSSDAGRGGSRGGSRSKRKHRHNESHASGTKSAPASRGTDNGDSDDLWPPEPPMTEPERRCPSDSPLLRPHTTVNFGSTTPMRCGSLSSLPPLPNSAQSTRRPPSLPKGRSSSCGHLGDCSPSCSPAACYAEDGYSAGVNHASRNAFGATVGSLAASPSPSRPRRRSDGYGYPNRPDIPELPLAGRRSGADSACGSAKSSGRSITSVRSGRCSYSVQSLPLSHDRRSPGLPPRDLAQDLCASARPTGRAAGAERCDRDLQAPPPLPGSFDTVAMPKSSSSRDPSPKKPRGGDGKGDHTAKKVTSRDQGRVKRGGYVAPEVCITPPTDMPAHIPKEAGEGIGRMSASTAIPSASSTAESASEDGHVERKDYGWDEGEGGPACLDASFGVGGIGRTASSSSKRLSSLRCIRGSKGSVTGFTISEAVIQEARTGSKMGLGGSSVLDETMNSPDAVKGSTFVWVRGDVIGHGTLGSVFKALDQKTGQIFAVKEVRIDSKDNADVKFKESLENEVSIYKDLHHPRIVGYLGHDDIGGSLYIYLEYMPGGSVTQVLSQFGAFDESLISTYTRDLVEGLEYLHTRDPVVLHRDVKGANILVGLDCRVKLSDFGCSKRTADTFSQSLRGSIPWMAPEVIQQTGYGRRSDVWSLGCVVIEMATAQHPWGNFDNPMAAMVKIGMSSATPPLPQTVSDLCRNFISSCVQRDKNLRPTATDLLKHEFVQSVCDPFA